MKCLVNCAAVVSALLLVISCSEAANLAQGKWKSMCPYVGCFKIVHVLTHPFNVDIKLQKPVHLRKDGQWGEMMELLPISRL